MRVRYEYTMCYDPYLTAPPSAPAATPAATPAAAAASNPADVNAAARAKAIAAAKVGWCEYKPVFKPPVLGALK
jgi:hypothetical protein